MNFSALEKSDEVPATAIGGFTKGTSPLEMAAAYAIAAVIPDEEITTENIIASPLNKSVAASVAKAVADCWTLSQK